MARFEILEIEAMEGDNTWAAAPATRSGFRHDTGRRLGTRAAAERRADGMRRAFAAGTAPPGSTAAR